MIYFDNNATTRILPEVLEAMMPYLTGNYGNPSSGYSFAMASRNAIETARVQVARLVGAAESSEIIFTSGGTESDNWSIVGALERAKFRHLVTTAIEHEAVRNLAERLERLGTRVTRIGVDGSGLIDLGEVRSAISPETSVVSIMHANNETGVLFPAAQIAEIAKERSNALVHVDGVNAVGKVPIDLKNTAIDLYAVSGHKFHAPKGVGALYIKKGTALPPLLTGGGQENGRRPGTPAVHQIAGLGAAADIVADLSKMTAVKRLRDRLESGVLGQIPATRLNGTAEAANRLPNTSNISFENLSGEAIMAMLDEKGFCVSTGSACASGSHEASAVLAAMNIPYSFAMGAIRFSLGRLNHESDVDALLAELPEVISTLRKRAGIT